MADPVADLRALFDAFNRRDWAAFEAVVARFDPGFALTLPRAGRPPVSRDEYVPLVKGQLEDHPDLRYEVGAHLAGDGDEVALLLERHYTRHGSPFALPLCIVARVQDGTIHAIVEYAAAPHR